MATANPIAPARGVLAWRNLPPRFMVNIEDDSMAPRMVRGFQVVIDTTRRPQDGEGVLVVDDKNEAHLRIYRDTWDGHFEAVPLNPASHAPRFDSKIDSSLRVPGVVVKTMCPDELYGECAALGFRLLDAVRLWRTASKEATAEGRAFDDFDCYAHLGHRSRAQAAPARRGNILAA